jgi:hypothetical protein
MTDKVEVSPGKKQKLDPSEINSKVLTLAQTCGKLLAPKVAERFDAFCEKQPHLVEYIIPFLPEKCMRAKSKARCDPSLRGMIPFFKFSQQLERWENYLLDSVEEHPKYVNDYDPALIDVFKESETFFLESVDDNVAADRR